MADFRPIFQPGAWNIYAVFEQKQLWVAGFNPAWIGFHARACAR